MSAPADEIVDLFAGPGGWSEACKALGLVEIGVEHDAAACATRIAAGHHTIRADVAALDPADFDPAPGLIASPPCQAFSTAGKGAGADLIPELADAIRRRDWTARPDPDPKVWLVLEVGRWIDALRPEWVTLEQVPAVLPLWEQYARNLRASGYSTWTGILNAADYGVPQIRRRAILIASRTRTAHPPPATHDENPVDGLFGTLERWQTMADALGWVGAVGLPRLDDRGDSPDGYRERDWRTTDEPSFTVTEKARSWSLRTGANSTTAAGVEPYQRSIDRPAPTVDVKTGRGWRVDEWPYERPATTLACDPRVFAPGGHIAHDGRDNTKMIGRSENTIRIKIADALTLQSFRPDYPVTGTKTKQFEQIGNAIPPRLAAAILRQVC